MPEFDTSKSVTAELEAEGSTLHQCEARDIALGLALGLKEALACSTVVLKSMLTGRMVAYKAYPACAAWRCHSSAVGLHMKHCLGSGGR